MTVVDVAAVKTSVPAADPSVTSVIDGVEEIDVVVVTVVVVVCTVEVETWSKEEQNEDALLFSCKILRMKSTAKHSSPGGAAPTAGASASTVARSSPAMFWVAVVKPSDELSRQRWGTRSLWSIQGRKPPGSSASLKFILRHSSTVKVQGPMSSRP
jgi:hypothetical protein